MANYTPYTWADGSQGNTPITAYQLNHIEDGIGANSTDISSLDSRVTSLEGKGVTQLLHIQASGQSQVLDSGAKEYALSQNWNDFDLLIFNGIFFGNVVLQLVAPAYYFDTTVAGAKVFAFSNSNAAYEFSKGSSYDKITIKFTPNTTAGTNSYGVNIVGIKL